MDLKKTVKTDNRIHCIVRNVKLVKGKEKELNNLRKQKEKATPGKCTNGKILTTCLVIVRSINVCCLQYFQLEGNNSIPETKYILLGWTEGGLNFKKTWVAQMGMI